MNNWPRIILLGDSITQLSFNYGGWGAHIVDLAQRKCDVFNRGFTGYTTEYIVKILDELVDSVLVQNVAAVTIFLGANDSCLNEINQKQHVPLDTYKANLVKIVEQFEKHGVTTKQMIIISPPTVDEKAWLEAMMEKEDGDKCDRLNEVTGKYAKVCEQIALSKGCRFVNLWDKMMAHQNYSIFLSDGLHLSEEGNKLLVNLLENDINELIDPLPTILPLWKDFPL